VPDRPGLRPTPDRVRETLFNWLQPIIAGAECLDLFAGTGVLGLEAISRGAKSVVFVEKDPRVAACLEENIATLGAEQASLLVRGEALAWLKHSALTFDLIFLDPPFGEELVEQSCLLIHEKNRLAKDGLVYIEGARDLQIPPAFAVVKRGSAGQVNYMLIKAVNSE